MSDCEQRIQDEISEAARLPFLLNSRVEVERFEEMLNEHMKTQMNGLAISHISLPKVFDLCQRRQDGGKIFTAVLDIQINLAMLLCEQWAGGVLWNKHFMQEFQVTSILDSQEVFDAKMKIHRHTTNFVMRYRALWDKIMGAIVRVLAPNEYEGFAAAKSKKAKFKAIIAHVAESEGFADTVMAILEKFDNVFRTPEVHGTGAVRKFTLSMQGYENTPLIDLLYYWNVVNEVVASIGEMIDKAE